jgi:DNA polymerase-3 subunit beta
MAVSFFVEDDCKTCKTLTFEFGGTSLYTIVVNRQYPSYKELIPREFQCEVTFSAEDLKRALEQLRPVAGSDSTVRLVWANGTMTVAVSDVDRTAECTLPVNAGDSGCIAFGMDLLLPYLKDKEGTVTMAVRSSSSPAVFRHPLSPLVVLMPRFIQW